MDDMLFVMGFYCFQLIEDQEDRERYGGERFQLVLVILKDDRFNLFIILEMK